MTSITCLQCLLLIPISLFLFLPVIPVLANTTLAPNQSLAGDETLVSEDQCFEFGFFSPGVSRNRYLGIWYKNISPQTVVWVANRNTPLTDSFGVLKMDEYGNLLLVNKSKKVIWSSKGLKQRSPIAEETITKLLDSGNLIVRKVSGNDNDPNSYQWQSFDHLTNTFLQGMKLGWDLGVGVNNSLTSWKSDEDPSPGEYFYGMAPGDSPELYLFKQQTIIYRSGPWNGVMFSGVPEVKPSDGFFTEFVINGTQKLHWFVATHQYGISRVVMDKSGKLLRLVSLGGGQGWTDYWHGPRDECDNYKKCGAYGICFARDDLPICKCVKGFQPKNQSNWNSKDTLGGCVRKRNFLCGKDDGFLKFKGMKLPDCSKAYYNHSMNLKECAHMCKKNCSCTAYARSDIRKGVDGCLNWYGDLVDLRQYTAYGQTLYVRVVASELDNHHKSIVIIIAIIVMSTVLLLGSICFIWRKRILQQRDKDNRKKSLQLAQSEMFFSKELENDNLELPLLDFHVIAATTEDFSDKNMLGQGGFGYVYKGSLANGQQIAVKRLSKTSGQGVDEFKNEVMLIAKLQHRNLVRLLGCCIDNDERILIYEYMPNKSLDYFLFDKSQRLFLDWGRRFNIIVGIARGLLYLHQDSRLKIIHRDLKASNILLDDEMNPKISDFGMARIFGSNQSEANTNRVVGTYGYMAPEYAMDGLFSLKSDVFSYGVLVLEIISGKKNKGFYTAGNELNLLGYAWILWEQGKGLELMDESMGDTLSTNEVLKCIQIGLLCVQERAEDRPSISSVILMLGSETTTLAQPKQPGFSLGRSTNGAYSSSNDQESCSVSEGTTAMLEAR